MFITKIALYSSSTFYKKSKYMNSMHLKRYEVIMDDFLEKESERRLATGHRVNERHL